MRVLDARTPDDFAAGHVRGSINVGFDGRFAETGGMVADIGGRIALITYPDLSPSIPGLRVKSRKRHTIFRPVGPRVYKNVSSNVQP